ncbi:MAG: right-handed parallel beta-helix repeat-containing protein, partial [Acidobacteriota bacterium]
VKEAAHDNLVEHNRCTKQLDDESGGLDARGDNNTFRYNEIYGNKGAGVRLGGDSDSDGINNHVYGNTIRDNGGNGIKILRSPQGKICENTFSNNAESSLGGEYGEGRYGNITCPE